MATYPIKLLKDESGQPFVPLTSLDAVLGEKNLQYIFDAAQTSTGHFKIEYEKLELQNIKDAIIVVRWPNITSTVKPSYLQLNDSEEVILYNGTGTEYLDLEDASNTIHLLAYDGEKWIQASGSGAGGGHVITNSSGQSMEQQKVLSFVGFNVENDTANRATKIINPTPINNLTTNESGKGSLDAYQGYILSGRTIPTGGSTGQVLAKKNGSDYQVEWVDKDDEGVIQGDGSITQLISLTYEEYKQLEQNGLLSPTTQYNIIDMADKNVTYITEEDIQKQIDNTMSHIGDVRETSFSDVVVTSKTTLASLTIPAGVWMICAHCQYQTQNLRWYLSLDGAAIQMGAYDNSGWIDGQIAGIVTPSVNTTYTLFAWAQDENGREKETNCNNGYIKAVRIK